MSERDTIKVNEAYPVLPTAEGVALDDDVAGGPGMNNVIEQLCTPSLFTNMILTISMFFTFLSIAISSNAFIPFVAYFIFLLLFFFILLAFYLRKKLLLSSYILLMMLFMFFYNYFPIFFSKNVAPNNYILFINCCVVIAGIIVYSRGLISNIKKAEKIDDNKGDLEMLEKIKNPQSYAFSNIFINIFFASLAAFVCVGINLGTFGAKYMPNYIVSSNVNVCSRPTNQTFKCSVYKNGELVK